MITTAGTLDTAFVNKDAVDIRKTECTQLTLFV